MTLTLARVIVSFGCHSFGLDRSSQEPAGKGGYVMILLSKLYSMNCVPSGPSAVRLMVTTGFLFRWFTLRFSSLLFSNLKKKKNYKLIIREF